MVKTTWGAFRFCCVTWLGHSISDDVYWAPRRGWDHIHCSAWHCYSRLSNFLRDRFRRWGVCCIPLWIQRAHSFSIQWDRAVASVEWDIRSSYSSRTLPDDTMVTFSFTECNGPAVLFLAQCLVLARIHFSLFSSSCSHIIKCTVTRFPEAFRCIQPSRMWVATFLSSVVKWRPLLLPDSSRNPTDTI